LNEWVKCSASVIGKTLKRQLPMGLARNPIAKFLNDARLTDTGLSRQEHDLAISFLGLPPTHEQQGNFFFAVDQGSKSRTRAGRKAACKARGSKDLPSLHGIRNPLEAKAAEILILKLYPQQRPR